MKSLKNFHIQEIKTKTLGTIKVPEKGKHYFVDFSDALLACLQESKCDYPKKRDLYIKEASYALATPVRTLQDGIRISRYLDEETKAKVNRLPSVRDCIKNLNYLVPLSPFNSSKTCVLFNQNKEISFKKIVKLVKAGKDKELENPVTDFSEEKPKLMGSFRTQKALARKLYQEGKPIQELIPLVSVSSKTLYGWLLDLINGKVSK